MAIEKMHGSSALAKIDGLARHRISKLQGGLTWGYFSPRQWSTSDKSAAMALTNGNLTVTKSSGETFTGARAALGVSSGKWYWELTVVTAATNHYALVGVGSTAQTLTDHIGNSTSGWAYYQANGNKVTADAESAYGDSWKTGDVIGVALDMNAGKIWFRKNSTWMASGDPAAGTNPAFTGLSGTLYPMASFFTVGNSITANFGGSAFSASAPSGFSAF